MRPSMGRFISGLEQYESLERIVIPIEEEEASGEMMLPPQPSSLESL